mmetsp:Transcript_29019/g.66417  ORF Transcript_29019/g.66417 Transcript_29019/m.66417 type:complete len:203 (-) Transcript_29019:617-1225(-)
MFHLQPRVELQKVKLFVFLRIEILHRTRVGISHRLGQLHRRFLHLGPDVVRGRHGGSLLDDLLMSALHGTVASVQSQCLAILVRDQLDLQVSRPRGQFHDEDGRTGNLPRNLAVGVGHVLRTVHHADALPAPALAGLDHDGKADLRRGHRRRGHRSHVRPSVVLCGKHSRGAIVLGHDVRAVPSDAGDSGALSDDGAADLVS